MTTTMLLRYTNNKGQLSIKIIQQIRSNRYKTFTFCYIPSEEEGGGGGGGGGGGLERCH